MTTPVADRLAALRRMEPPQLAEILRRVPAVAEAVSGAGPLSPYGAVLGRPHRSAGSFSVPALATLLASHAAIDLTLASLNRFELQLATLAAWHGGHLTRADALAEAGPDSGPALDEAAGVLDALLLADRDREWLVLRPGVKDVVPLPGVPARDGMAFLHSEQLAALLRRLGETRPPARKADRLDAVVARLCDSDVIRAVAVAMPPEVLRVFKLLLGHGPQRVRDLGVPYYSPWGARQATPVHWLAECGLIGVDVDAQVCWIWLDVLVAVRGSLFDDWRAAPPEVPTTPLHDAGGGLPVVLSRLTALLDLWATDPAPALATGGLGVRPVRAAAKTLGVPPGEVGLLAHLAIGLGLLGTVSAGSKGRGRNRTEILQWAPTELVAEFQAQPAALRWALLVQAWRDDPRLNDFGGLPERTAEGDDDVGGNVPRAALARVLRDLPAGSGLAADDLADRAEFLAPLLLPAPATGGLVAAARALGLVPGAGPVGLTALGRAVLEGPDAVEAALPEPRSEFTVQADHTVIAPPDLAPEVTAALERYAEVESAAGARVYRLSERRIAAALADGDTADGILDFLRRHSTVEIAQNVAYLVTDCARRHGRLRAGAVGSYLRCDDPALLTRAAEVRSAKLTLLAPGVAVSPLTRDKLVETLRQRGLLPVAESVDGAELPAARTVAVPRARSRGRLPEFRPAGGVTPGELEVLAKSLLEDREDTPRALFGDRSWPA